MNKAFIKTPKHLKSLGTKLLCALVLLVCAQQKGTAQWRKVGTDKGSNDTFSYPTPYGNANAGQKAQYLYRKTDLDAAGVKAGWIDSLGFFVVKTNEAVVHGGLRFYVGSTPVTALLTYPTITGVRENGWIKDVPLRYEDGALGSIPYLGWNNFGFNEPFYWDGTSNIVVGTCFWGDADYRNASVEWDTALGFAASRTLVAKKTTFLGLAVCDDETTAVSKTINDSTKRPNIHFYGRSDTCTGKPEAGAAVASVGTFCMRDDSIVLSLRGNVLGNGLSFQWQRTLDLSTPWTNYGPARTTAVNRRAFQTQLTYYRCVVTCLASGLKDTSDYIYVRQSDPFECDCSSVARKNTDEKILRVNLASLDNITPCDPSGGAGFYGDYINKIPDAELEPSSTYTLTLRLGTCGKDDHSRAVKVFIDFNRNSEYEVSEMVYANSYSAAQPNPQNAVGTFTVPAGAQIGRTSMRVIYAQVVSLSDIRMDGCGNYDFGETQDYGINILPFGTPKVTGRLVVCEHDSVVMNVTSNADTPVVFKWTGPGGFTGIGPKITFTDADPSLSGTYYVTATSGGRTSTPRAVEVIVYPKPAVPNVLNKDMCQYEPDGKLKTDGMNVLWYNVPVGGFGDTTAPTMITYTPNTATFYVTQTVNGCVSDRGMVTARVYLKPPPPIVVTPVSYCQLQDPDLVAKGQNLKWYLDSAGGIPSVISPTPPTGLPDTVGYYVTQTINGCESDRSRVTVYVYAQPNGIILQSKKFVCQYDTASFSYFGNAPATYSYKWYASDPTSVVYVKGGTGQVPVVYRFNKPGDFVINLYVNNGNCATFRITDTITVRPAPSGDIKETPYTCVDVPAIISMDSTTPNSYGYVWDWNGGKLQYETVDGGPYGVSWSTPGLKTIKLVLSNRECPSLPIYETVLVRPKPTARITSIKKITNYGADTTILSGQVCAQDTLYFTAFNDTSMHYRFKWTPTYFFDVDTTQMVWDRIRNPAYVGVHVVDKWGCVNSDSTFINAEPCCNMAFPNAFTPNNDGLNDRFKPLRDGRQEIITYRIVSRWGTTVFESASSDSEGWDGTFAGRPMDMGVYNYYIKYRCLDGTVYEQKGDVTLIR